MGIAAAYLDSLLVQKLALIQYDTTWRWEPETELDERLMQVIVRINQINIF